MKHRVPRAKKKHLKAQYYAVLDAVVQEKWRERGYLLHQRLIRRLRRKHFKTKPGEMVVTGRGGATTLRLDGRSP